MEFNESLVKDSVTRTLVKFAMPVVLANLLQIVYTLTDLYILSNFANEADVSAMSTSAMTMSLVTLGLSGIISGLMITLGQYYGARSRDELGGAVGSGTVFFLIIAAAITVPFVLLNHWLVTVMNTPPEAVAAARGYLLVCSCGIVFIIGFSVIGSIFRGLGNSKLAMYFAAISCGVNIALDLLLIAVLGMGAVGAAIATVAAQGLSLLLAVLYIWRRGLGFKIARADFRPRARYIKNIAKIGAPISVQEILVTISFMMITSVINKRGVYASASVGIVERLMGMFTMPTMAIAAAVGAMAAQNIGSNQRERAEKCMWSGIVMALVIALPVCVFCVFFGELPISLFGNEQEIINNGALYLKSYVLDAAGLAFVFVFSSFFTSCGYSLFAMAQSIAVTFLVRVPVVFLMARTAGTTLFHIGLGAPLATLVSIALCVIFFFHIRKRPLDAARLAA